MAKRFTVLIADFLDETSIESAVLDDLARRAGRHSLATPLLDTARVVLNIHARRIAETR